MIDFNGRKFEPKFTFNSFKYMGDFDLSVLGEIENKPFKMIEIATMLLMGALNHNPKVKVSSDLVDAILENAMVEGTLGELIPQLIDELNNSDFFKKLQEKQQTI